MSKDSKHAHKWLLGNYEPEWYRTEPVYSGIFGGVINIPILPAEPAISTFVCECGAKKEVIHKEPK